MMIALTILALLLILNQNLKIPHGFKLVFHKSYNSKFCTAWKAKPIRSDDSGLVRGSSFPKIGQDIIDLLSVKLNTIVSSLAIDTVTYYMLEFRNEVTQRWMAQFCNYSANGFPDGDWTKYLEAMITTSDLKIQVIMRPPQSFIRGKKAKLNSNVVIQYDAEIEPRKVAHQILTVRENVCEELISDLNTIQIENIEADRYATQFLADGKQTADKARKSTRQNAGGSTPNRDRNYNELNLLLTEYTMEIIRKDCAEKGDLSTIQYLDSFLTKFEEEFNALSFTDQFFTKSMCTRSMLEKLSIDANVNSLQNSPIDASSHSNTVNVLKLSQSVHHIREALATQAQGILRYQNSGNRQYYKMIKDYGGIFSLRRSKPPQQASFALLDLDAERRRLEMEAEEAEAFPPNSEQIRAEVEENVGELVAAVALSDSGCSEVDTADADLITASPTTDSIVEDLNLFDTDFGTAGPTFM